MERRHAIGVIAVMLLLVGCAGSNRRYRWDMERNPPGSQREVLELRMNRLLVPGLTEKQVRRIWGSPDEKTAIPPHYKSLTYRTRDGWVTVVFDRNRVVRVEALKREGAGTDENAQRLGASERPARDRDTSSD